MKEKSTPPNTKSEIPNSSQKYSIINCFKCLKIIHIVSQCSNKKIILLRDYDRINSGSDYDNEDNDSIPPMKDVKENVEYSA